MCVPLPALSRRVGRGRERQPPHRAPRGSLSPPSGPTVASSWPSLSSWWFSGNGRGWWVM